MNLLAFGFILAAAAPLTFKLAPSGVRQGTVTNPVVTFDSRGRAISAENGRPLSYVNAMDFGPSGDGSATDDTSELQAAIDKVPEGGALYIPAGNYLVSSTLTINKSMSIFGDGNKTAIYYAPWLSTNADVIKFSATSAKGFVELSKFAIRPHHNYYTYVSGRHLIAFDCAVASAWTNVLIRNLYLESRAGNAIRVDNSDGDSVTVNQFCVTDCTLFGGIEIVGGGNNVTVERNAVLHNVAGNAIADGGINVSLIPAAGDAVISQNLVTARGGIEANGFGFKISANTLSQAVTNTLESSLLRLIGNNSDVRANSLYPMTPDAGTYGISIASTATNSRIGPNNFIGASWASLTNTIEDLGVDTVIEGEPTVYLGGLQDVDTNGVVIGSVLKYDGINWVVGIDNSSAGTNAAFVFANHTNQVDSPSFNDTLRIAITAIGTNISLDLVSGSIVTNLLATSVHNWVNDKEPLNASKYQSTNANLTELSASGSTGSGAFVRAISPTIASPTLTGTTSIETNNVGVLVVTNFSGTVPEANIDAAILRDSEAASAYQPLDADLTDLADGSLTGSKVGTGIDGGNITAGTIADARIDSAIARDSEVAAAYEPLNANKYQATNSVLSDLVSAGSTGTGATVRSNSPALGGTPTTPTAAPGTSNTVVASTAFVADAVAGLSAGPGGGGDVYTTSNNVFTGINAFGVVTANTPAVGDNSTNVATTQWAIREFNTSTRRGVVTRIYGNCIAQGAANAMLPFTGAAISSGTVGVDAPFSSAIGDRFGIVNLRTATGVTTGTGYYFSTSLTEAYATNGLLFSTKFVPSITNGTLARLGWGDSINTANDTDACILALSNSVVVGLVINNGSQAMTPTSFVIPQGVLSEGKTWISNSITHFEVSTNNVVAWQSSLTNAPPATTSRVFGAIIKMFNTAAAATNAAVCLKIDDFLLEYPQ